MKKNIDYYELGLSYQSALYNTFACNHRFAIVNNFLSALSPFIYVPFLKALKKDLTT